jgi:branched-chain amino acid transport system substrate-binding protein
MGELLLVEQDTLEGPAGAVFSAIEAGAVPGWELTGGTRLAVGVPVRMPVTLPASLGGRRVELLGRVAALSPGRRLVVEYHLPWRGSVMLNASPLGPERCRVRMTVQVDDSALDWLDRARGGLGDLGGRTAPNRHRIGLLVSASGAAAVFAAASENVARLAVEELNADGGVGRRPIELVVGDDATDPRMGAAELNRLAMLGCRVVITNVTSATFEVLRPLAERLRVLLIYTPVNEGGPTLPGVLHLGERPVGQLQGTVPRLMRQAGGRRWFLAGNDYCWPRATNQQAQRIITRRGGVIVGERYERLGSRDFSPLLEAIQRSRAELIVSTFVGADEAAFERQFYQAGLRDRCQTLALALEESTRDHIGAEAAQGIWNSFGYFEGLATAENQAFLARYRARFGAAAPPVSSMSESVYDALHLYADAARATGTDGGRLHLDSLIGRSFAGPRGPVRVGPAGLEQTMHVACAGRAGFELIPT